MKACIDKRVNENDDIYGLYLSLNERVENILNENYKTIVGSDAITEQVLLDSKRDSDFKKMSLAPIEVKEKLIELAIWRDKKWAIGRTLRIKFLGGSANLRQRVMEKAMIWTKFANLNFQFVKSGDAEIRIAFQEGKGSWSYLGVDCLNIAQDQPTMNFGWFNEFTREFEISRTVLHEFGHALGCIHEHQSPSTKIPWDRKAVYKYYWESQRWSKEQVDNNIFKLYDSSTISNSSFDRKSIMLYPIDSQLTTNGFEVGMNYLLSPQDINYIRAWYPGR